jgi:hypothetical protein
LRLPAQLVLQQLGAALQLVAHALAR